MVYFVELMHVGNRAPENASPERVQQSYRSVYEAHLAGSELLNRGKREPGTLTFRIVDEHGVPVAGGDGRGLGTAEAI